MEVFDAAVEPSDCDEFTRHVGTAAERRGHYSPPIQPVTLMINTSAPSMAGMK